MHSVGVFAGRRLAWLLCLDSILQSPWQRSFVVSTISPLIEATEYHERVSCFPRLDHVAILHERAIVRTHLLGQVVWHHHFLMVWAIKEKEGSGLVMDSDVCEMRRTEVAERSFCYDESRYSCASEDPTNSQRDLCHGRWLQPGVAPEVVRSIAW